MQDHHYLGVSAVYIEIHRSRQAKILCVNLKLFQSLETHEPGTYHISEQPKLSPACASVSLARAFAACIDKVWIKVKIQAKI